MVQEGLLETAEGALRREALDRHDLAAVGLDGQDEARVDDPSVETDGAGAALPDEAALLRAREGQVVTKDIQERVVGRDLQASRDGR